MNSHNPYVAPLAPAGQSMKCWRQLVVGSLAIVCVLAVAIVAGSIAPTIASLAGAPSEFTTALMRASLSVCIPFGLLVAYFTSRYACRRTSIASILWFLSALLIVIALELLPRTRGPLVEYTGFALVLIILSAVCIGLALRPFTKKFEDGNQYEPE
jgi:hypothetical protein